MQTIENADGTNELIFDQKEINISVNQTLDYLCQLVASGEVEAGTFILEYEGIDIEVSIKAA